MWMVRRAHIVSPNMEAFAIDGLSFVSGDPVSIEVDVKGRGVLLLERFASWCPPCRKSVPHLVGMPRLANSASSLLTMTPPFVEFPAGQVSRARAGRTWRHERRRKCCTFVHLGVVD